MRAAPSTATARALLTEAGHPNGFTVTLDCPVGTHDEACQAVAAMLAPVGIRAQLNLQPKTVFLGRLPQRETVFYGLSWGVPTFNALYAMRSLMVTRERAGVATWNIGGYSNPRFDELTGQVEAETNPDRRRALIREAHAPHNADARHTALYHTMIPWATRQNVTITHRADNRFAVRDIRLD
jgi:peptide/nickel transport system substrate-binding protein